MAEELKPNDWEIAVPEQVLDSEELVIPLKRPIEVNGAKYESMKLRYPNRGDIKRMNKQKKTKKLDDDEMTEFLIMNLAVEPLMTPQNMDNLAQSDFLYIQKRLDESGFFGIVRTTKNL